jgi:general secretion pathway protein K
MALIIVLWLIVLLGVMAAGHARNVHSDTMLAARQVELAQARALAEAGAQHAIISLLTQNNPQPLPIDGTFAGIEVDGHAVKIAIRDATGLVDLNAAGADLLADLISVSGIDPSTQRDIVDAILDWRDADELRHLHGAEDDDYLAADLGWTARDGAFAAVEELKYVKGVGQDLFDRLVPFITVYSGRPGVNLDYAPPALVSLLTGDHIERSARASPATGQAAAGSSLRGVRSGTYHVYATVAGAGKVVASLEMVVSISATPERPFTILERREPMRAPMPSIG